MPQVLVDTTTLAVLAWQRYGHLVAGANQLVLNIAGELPDLRDNLRWDGATGLRKATAQELAAASAADLANAKTLAKALLDSPSVETRALVGLMLAVLDQFNLQATTVNAILSAVAAANSLTALKTAVGAITPLQTHTAADVVTVLKNKIDGEN